MVTSRWQPPPSESTTAVMRLPDFRRWRAAMEAVNLSSRGRQTGHRRRKPRVSFAGVVPAGKQTVRLSSYYSGHPPIFLPVPLWERVGWGRGTVRYRQRALGYAKRLRYLLEIRPEWMGPSEAEAVGRLAEWLEQFKKVGRCRIHLSFRK